MNYKRRLPVSASSSLTRPQHERIWRIFRLIAAGDYPNCTDFVRELETSRRSVMRDLDYLRDRLGMPIEFDSKQRGYFFTRPVEQMPVIEMSGADVLALAISEQVLASHASPSVAARLQQSFSRLYALLGNPLKLSGSELHQILHTKQPGRVAVDLDKLEAVGRALAEGRELRFQYDGGGRDLAARRINGINLTYSSGQWYLVADDLDRSAPRVFAVSRMKRIRAGRRGCAERRPVMVERLARDVFGIANEGRPVETVVVRFSARVAKRVVEREWHVSQRIAVLDDGSCRLEMRLSPTGELKSWLMSWGCDAELETPLWLRREIAEELSIAEKNYR